MRLFPRRMATWMAGPTLIVVAVAFIGVRGDGDARPMLLTSGTDFSISGTVSGLTPGSTGNLQLTVTNPKSVPITVKTLSVTLGTPLPPGCGPSNLDLTGAQYGSATGFNVPANNGTASTVGLTVKMVNTGTNQDGCKNVTFPLAYDGTAQYTQVFNTSTSLASSVNPSVLGQAVTFTATVAAGAPQQGTGMAPSGPTGSVAFKDGAVTLGSAALAANGTATFPTSSLATGTHPITAVFSNADGNFAASTSSPVSQVVNNPKKTSTTTVSSSLNPSVVGESVTFTASVASQATGTVTFSDNGAPFGGPQALVKGAASVTTTSLAAGTHQITAAYSGDATFSPSTSTAFAQVVNKRATTTALTSSPNPSVAGGPVTFTATVTSGSATPTGSVTFSNGATTLGSGALNANGVAMFTSSALAPAATSYTITAAYGGDATFSGSSGTVSQKVKATPTVTLTSNNNPAKAGQSVTLTITVAGGVPSAPPGGTVTVSVDGVTKATLTIGTSPLTYTTSSLSVGSHTVTATYSGDANYVTGSASLTERVVR